ncbi:MAG: cytochrome c [Planctomycetota bacterium]|nr:cytochrome c [Planctomycetota bacterium]
MRNLFLLVPVLLAGLAFAACGGEDATTPSGDSPKAPPSTEPAVEVTYDEHGDPEGIHRHRRWSDRVGQGAQPAGDIAFRNLKALGYTTVLSVDGAIPDVEGAEKHGLRYIHIPIGYDGVPEESALQIAAILEQTEGPVFVHCHHGKHRGPAAAMVLRICEDKISNDQAVHEMEISKTSKNYDGLYRDILAYKAPSAEKLASVKPLPSKVTPQGVRAGMVDVNLRWDHLKIAKESRWKASDEHPDISPPHEARMLWELYREMGRTDTETQAKGEKYLGILKQGEELAIELEKAIRASDAAEADKLFGALKNNCKMCHDDYRN